MEWSATQGFGYTLRCLHVINYTQSVFQTNETSRSPLLPLFVTVASASIGSTAVVSFLIVIRYACIQSACSASYGTQTVDLEAKTKGRNEKSEPCVRLRAETDLYVEKRQPRTNANCFISVDRLSIVLMLMDIRSTFDAPEPEDSLAVYLS